MKFQLLIKTKMLKIERFFWFQDLRCLFIMPINVKMPTIVGILTSMCIINVMLSSVELTKSFITSGPG